DSLSAPLRSFWLLSWTLSPWLVLENILSYDFSLRKHLIPIEKDAYFPSARGSNGRLKRSRMHPQGVACGRPAGHPLERHPEARQRSPRSARPHPETSRGARIGFQITRSLPPSTGTCAPVVLANSGPHISAASSATSRLVISTPKTLFFLYCSTLNP